MANLGVVTILALICAISALPEQGMWTVNLNPGNQLVGFTKSVYNQTKIYITLTCDANPETELKISWMLRYSPCAEEYIGVEKSETRLFDYLKYPEYDQLHFGYDSVHFLGSQNIDGKCGQDTVVTLPDLSETPPTKAKAVRQDENTNTTETAKVKKDVGKDETAARMKRQVLEGEHLRDGVVPPQKTDPPAAKVAAVKTTSSTKKPTPSTMPTTTKLQEATTKRLMPAGQNGDGAVVAKTWEDGIYLFVLQIQSSTSEEIESAKFNAPAVVKIKGPAGYISAIEWPLLPFYGIMCVVYLISGLVWLVLSALNWRDLLRIQFWIGAVVFLGMFEKAVFFAEYESINSTGKSVRGAVIFAELVSCLKRSLARMLVVIVSLGFGIVKPRLGAMLHKVVGVGALYFILGSVEGCLRALRAKGDASRQALLASVPLAVLDAAICWWVFSALVQTTRTLRLRRNVIKLSLYRHFTNTLIFAVLASIAFMIWSIKQHKLANCLSDWKEIWVDDAFWHMLFSVILMVIMILWRPNNNNQRYAFSPLLDAAEDEEDESMLSDAFEGMKMRNSKEKNGTSRAKDANKPDDDLKWIEENIPSSVTDTALPSLLDSDEEIMTTKFEMSKME